MSQALFLFVVFSIQRTILHGTKLARTAPTLTNILFTDDTSLFVQALQAEATNLFDLLQSYTATTGQLINYQNSYILFSKRTPLHLR